jgi:putative endonuclease
MSRKKGNIAELKAVEFLKSKGFKIIEQNFYSRFGEIDIITIKDNIYHFIEVKSADSYEVAILNVTPKKLSKITKTIDVYLKKNSLNVVFCIDAVIVSHNSIDLIENITI